MKVSVVIPTRNAGADLCDLLAIVRGQELEDEPEIVVIDSGSSDGTAERAELQGARVRRIPRAEFNHGCTRNLGIEMASGELVAFLTQDARPLDAFWLPRLVEPFSDARVAGSYSRVIPKAGVSPLVERSVKCDLVYGKERLYKRVDDLEAWRRLRPFERRIEAHFNNVASCVRRRVMQELPFPALSFGEDLAWGLRALESGWALVYQPTSVVVHSHSSGLVRDFRRHRADAGLCRRLLGERPGTFSALRSLVGEVSLDWVFLKTSSWSDRIRYGAYSPLLRSAQAAGRICGARLGDGVRDSSAAPRRV